MPVSGRMERFNNTDKSENVGRVNEGFEDIPISSDNVVNIVTINAEKDLNVDLSTKINIPRDATIEGDIITDNETNLHFWLCPSKVP